MRWPRLRDNAQRMVRLQVFDCQLHALTSLGENWPELLGVLFQASQSSDVSQREGAFRIFATTPTIIETQHDNLVLEAFTKGFKDEDVSVGRPSPRISS